MAFRVGRELGSGALGRVVEATDDAGRVWAAKLLHASQRGDERARRRFEAEARLLAGVAHPNLIRVEGLAEIEGEAALLMELVPGADLAHVIASEAPLPADRVIALGRGIAAGLAVAHAAGLVHRDLKPANILLAGDGTPKVADFGLARAMSFAGSDPDAIAVAGTPDYMAPESVDPLAIDARSDLYALGCILCELATGAPPYRAPTALAVLHAHRTSPLPALDGVPAELRRVIRWLLAKSPTDRPQSASEVETALGSLASPAALAVIGERAQRGVRACMHCGAPGPAIVRVCFACGEPQLELTAGPFTVFVTGPGQRVHKLDADVRRKLLAWLAGHPGIGLDAARLAKDVPRLPFVFVTGVDEASATELVRALTAIGMQATARRGGRFALEEMRSKSWTLARRTGLIGSTTLMAAQSSVAAMIGAVTVTLVSSVWRGFHHATRPVAIVTDRPPRELGTALDAALARVASVVPAMAAARHRDALRGVVERAFALRDVLAPEQRLELDPQLAQLIDVAALASSRLDQLEAELSPDDLRTGGDESRARWHARDRWAAKILQVTAFLDAMRARALMAKARGVAVADVDELRAQVEALEALEAVA